MSKSTIQRVAIYARYSTDLQNRRSIEDQVRDCRAYAASKGWEVVGTFADEAKSGTSLHRRQGMEALMRDAEKGIFEIVLSEALDRISRSLGDTAHLYEQLEFFGVRVVTISENDVTPMAVAFKGLMNGEFVRELARKIRRGQRGLVSEGRSAGGLAYGYEVVRDELDGRQEWVRGKRRPNEEQAAIVRRIFAEYVAGISPYEIVRRLNAEGIPTARGGTWGVSAIVGHRQRKVGILHNELYIGRLYYNRVSMRKNPKTGRRVSQLNPERDWIRTDVPGLRIIDDNTWNAAQVILARGGGARLPRQVRRPRHLLAGLVECPACGGNMVGAGVKHLICANAHAKRICKSSRKVDRARLEKCVLDHLRELLAHPDAVAAFVRAYHDETAARRRSDGDQRRRLTKDLADTTAAIARWMKAVEESQVDSLRPITSRIGELDRKRAELESALARLEPEQVTLHPNGHVIYAAKIANLEAALGADAETRMAACQTLRALIERIVVYPPAAPGAAPEVELRGRLADFLDLTCPVQANRTGTNEWDQLVAEEGFEPPTHGL